LGGYLTGEGSFKTRMQVVNIVLNVKYDSNVNDDINELVQDARRFSNLTQKKRANMNIRSFQQQGNLSLLDT